MRSGRNSSRKVHGSCPCGEATACLSGIVSVLCRPTASVKVRRYDARALDTATISSRIFTNTLHSLRSGSVK